MVRRVGSVGFIHQWRQDGFRGPTGPFRPLGVVRFPCSLAFQTAGEASQAMPFGLTLDGLERWALLYLGLSSLVFVAVWVVGYLRR